MPKNPENSPKTIDFTIFFVYNINIELTNKIIAQG
jgi:hypothetical protein